MFHNLAKRCFDILAGLLGIVLLSPIIIIVALVVFIWMGRPFLFIQSRSGLNGQAIELLKFRSMTNARDEHGKLLSDEQRTPKVGHLIRRYRVDELPSLLNIVRGDISLVGPRPMLAAAEANVIGGLRRLSVKPGLTGLAQISGNTLLSEHEKLAVDLYYIDNQTFGLDINIVAKTLLTVVLGERRDEKLIDRSISSMTGKGSSV